MARNRERQQRAARGTPVRGAGIGLGGAALAMVAAAGGWLAYSRWAIDHHLPLPPAIDAERRTFSTTGAGEISYYVDATASGRPLVLVHGVNACASAYEMRPLYERYRRSRPVYAIDLPGFGCSERADRRYTPALFAAAIAAFLRDQVRAAEGVDLIALSLGAEFAALVALEHPELVQSLTLISPTGFSARAMSRDAQATPNDDRGDRLPRVLDNALWSQAWYDLLVSRPSIRYFVARCFAAAPDRGLLDYDYLTAHQPGARFAPLAFLSGALFSPGIRERVYQRISQAALVLYDEDPFTRFDALSDTLLAYSNWRATRIPGTRGLPHFDQPDRTCQAIEAFWREQAEPTGSADKRGGVLGKRTRWLLHRSG